MASILNKEPAVYRQEQDAFLRELKKFHDQKGTSFKHIPKLNGKEIDLYLLYWLVTAQGGWEKVNSRNGWEDLLESFDLDPATTNGSLSLKQTYLRYLDSYEKHYFLGEEEEDEGGLYYDEEESRVRRQRQQRTVSVPLTYNESQHKISDTVRTHYGLSTDLYEPTDYDRLALSLLSPLPNEQDFAINVATLLSNEGRHTLKLGKCPRLLDLLLGHAGVFNHHNLRNYMQDCYMSVRNYDQVKFWQEVCRNTTVLELIYDERNFYPKPSEESAPSTSRKDDKSPADALVEAVGITDARLRLAALRERAATEVTESDIELFAVGRGSGTGELTGQRILQIATILRNLSFEEDNVSLLAKNLTCLRFVLLCVNSAWANLNQMGFDILSNIASEVQLEEPGEDAVTDLMIKSLSRCIRDQDRFQVISALDVLNKLCALSTNEELLQRLVDRTVYSQLVQYLSLHDIHLLITTLECLYSLSSLGEQPCNQIVKTHSAIELLVSLVTVEAQSYGPKACILMRVVETVPQPGTAAPLPAGQPLTSLPAATTATPAVLAPGGMAPARPVPTAPPVGPQGVQTPPGIPAAAPATSTGGNIQGGVALPKQPLPLGAAQQQQQQPMVSVNSSQMVTVSTGQQQQPNSNQQQPQRPPGSQQVQLRVSNDEPHRVFCLSWLKATYELAPGKSIEQNIMYKQYLASMHRMGRREVISAQHYALCIRTLFGGSTGPYKKQVGERTEHHYTGIQVRAQPLPLKLTPAQAAAAQEASRLQAGGQQQAANSLPQQPLLIPAQQQQQLAQQGQPVQQQQLIQQQAQPVQQLTMQQQPQPSQQPQHLIQQQQQPLVQQQQPVQQHSTPIGIQPGQQIVVAQGQVIQQPSGQVIQKIIHPPQQQPQHLLQQHQQVGNQIIQQAPGIRPQGQIVHSVLNAQGQIIQQRIMNAGQPQQQQLGQQQQGIVGGRQLVIQAGGVQQQQQQQAVIRPVVGCQPARIPLAMAEELLENGVSPLDGILPKDPAFGKVEDSFADLLEKKENCINGLIKEKQVNNHVDYSRLNGDASVKRGAEEAACDSTPAKKPALETTVITNGFANGNSVGQAQQQQMNGGVKLGGGGGHMVQVVSTGIQHHAAVAAVPVQMTAGGQMVQVVAGGQMVSAAGGGQMVQVPGATSNGGQLIVSSTGQALLVGGHGGNSQEIIQSSTGQLFLKTTTTNSSAGAVNQPVLVQQPQAVLLQQPGQQGKILFIHPQPEQQQQQQQHVVHQIVQTNSSGQQIIRQVVMQPQQIIQQQQQQPRSVVQHIVQQQPPQQHVIHVQSQQQQAFVSQPQPVVVQQQQQQILVQQQQQPIVVQQLQLRQQQPQQQPQQQQQLGNNPPSVIQEGAEQEPAAAAPQSSVIQRTSSTPASAPLPAPVMTNGRSTPTPSASQPPCASSPPSKVTVAALPDRVPCPSPPPVKVDTTRPFLCEWSGCLKAFRTPKEVERHAIQEHCPEDGEVDIPCLWARCDGMKRKRFSLMTHLQDRHCHPQLMKLMAVRRVQIMQNGRSDVPLPPAPPPHPGYAPNAALHAIKRHAQEFISPKENEMRDEKEGPVTKSIRLTASLILRNLVIYSSIGRSRLRAYESHLSTVALSNVESSRTVSQILFDMANAQDFP